MQRSKYVVGTRMWSAAQKRKKPIDIEIYWKILCDLSIQKSQQKKEKEEKRKCGNLKMFLLDTVSKKVEN